MKFTESIQENLKFLLKAVAPNKNNGTHSLKNQLIFLYESQFQGTHLIQLKVYLCPGFWDHHSSVTTKIKAASKKSITYISRENYSRLFFNNEVHFLKIIK